MNFAKTYLNPSSQFPVQDLGEPWGEEELILDFVGGPYHFSGLTPIQAEAIQDHFRDQWRKPDNGNPPSVKSVIHRIDPACFKDLDMEGGWLYESMDYSYQQDTVRLAGIQLLAQLNFGAELSAAMWTPLEEDDWFPGIVFENFFRILVAYRLLTMGGVILHSSGMVDQEGKKAMLFLGPSGAGKSTIAEIGYQAGYGIISDDLNSVIPHGDQLFVEKVPFSGTFGHDFCCGDSYPLHAVYRIIKGRKDHIEPISRAAALSVLLACSPFVNKDRYRFDLLSGNLEKIIDGIASYRLTFSLNGKCLDLLGEE